VTDHRDEIDSWLDADVQPLPPPPGTFERVSRRARQRKAGQAVLSAAGAAVLVTALAITPRVASSMLGHQGHESPGGVTAGSTLSPTPSGPAGGRGTTAAHSATSIPPPAPASSLSPGGSGQPVPPGFRPTSVTFIGPHTGAVIGQAGTPGQCGPPEPADCTSLAGTSDYGQSWYGVSAPVTGGPAGSAGVSGLRFLDERTGWAFGPELWVTHSGGAHWTPESTYGLRVVALEAAGDRAFALFASCAGTGADFAAQCTSFQIFSSSARSNSWQRVSGGAGDLTAAGNAAGQPTSASLVLAAGPVADPRAGTGYVLAPSGAVLSGPLSGGAWSVAGRAPSGCRLSGPPRGGRPPGAVLAAGSGELFVACTAAAAPGSSLHVKIVYASADGGSSWRLAGKVRGPGIATSLAAAQGGLVVLATTTCIDISADGGATWRQAYGSPPGAGAGRRGFSYVGMTDPEHGVAVPADAGLHEVLITVDGGSSWQPFAISG